jgi:hypothetical protein
MHPHHWIDGHVEQIFLTLGGHPLNTVHTLDRAEGGAIRNQRRDLMDADCRTFTGAALEAASKDERTR